MGWLLDSPVPQERRAHGDFGAHFTLEFDRAVVSLLLEVVDDGPEENGHDRGEESERSEYPDAAFEGVQSPHRSTIGQGEEVTGHLGRGAVPQAHIPLAGLDQDFVEFEELLGKAGLFGQGREVVAVVARGQFVEHLAQAVEVALDAVGPFRSDETRGADIGVGLRDGRNQADIRELGPPADEHHVGRLDVAMNEFLGMQELQGLGEGQTNLDRLMNGQGSTGRQITGQGARAIVFGNDVLSVDRVVSQFHDVVEELAVRAPADLEDIDKRVMDAGDGFEPLDALALALEGPFMVEARAGDDLDRAINAQNRTSQPHHPVTAGADGPDQLMVGNAGAWFVRLHGVVGNGWMNDVWSFRKRRSWTSDSLEEERSLYRRTPGRAWKSERQSCFMRSPRAASRARI